MDLGGKGKKMATQCRSHQWFKKQRPSFAWQVSRAKGYQLISYQRVLTTAEEHFGQTEDQKSKGFYFQEQPH